MKLFAGILMLLMTAGCTTLKPIELSPEQLQERITTGEVIHVGDNVQIVTSDGTRHTFKVTAITENSIAGKDVEIPTKDIIAIETREFSGGKTSLLAGGIVGGTLLLVIIVALSLPAILVL